MDTDKIKELSARLDSTLVEFMSEDDRKFNEDSIKKGQKAGNAVAAGAIAGGAAYAGRKQIKKGIVKASDKVAEAGYGAGYKHQNKKRGKLGRKVGRGAEAVSKEVGSNFKGSRAKVKDYAVATAYKGARATEKGLHAAANVPGASKVGIAKRLRKGARAIAGKRRAMANALFEEGMSPVDQVLLSSIERNFNTLSSY